MPQPDIINIKARLMPDTLTKLLLFLLISSTYFHFLVNHNYFNTFFTIYQCMFGFFMNNLLYILMISSALLHFKPETYTIIIIVNTAFLMMCLHNCFNY